MRNRNASRSVQQVFSEVYSSGLWGDGGTFDSGLGSRGAAASCYAAYIRDLISQSGARSAVDIGCGDFRVAKLFVDALETYEGIDVVNDLIVHDTTLHGRPGVRFSLLDASSDDLPNADICLIRQVLQHLSNSQIAGILKRCSQYPLVVVTEHLPSPAAARQPNLDKPHGPDIRLDAGSWVDIACPPFNCTEVSEVLRTPAPNPPEVIRTQLWRPATYDAI